MRTYKYHTRYFENKIFAKGRVKSKIPSGAGLFEVLLSQLTYISMFSVSDNISFDFGLFAKPLLSVLLDLLWTNEKLWRG